ncbi:MAG: response regulator [Thermodesulfobacteriota bacterium]
MQIKSLHSKILLLVVGVLSIGITLTVIWGYKQSEHRLLEEKLRASTLMSKPILNSIYEDMLEERADMARHLIEGLKDIEGIERVQIIRSNGREEAFQDLKTIKAVEIEFGETLPEWIVDHPEKKTNIARGVNTPGFLKALDAFKAGWETGAKYYVEEGEPPLFTYLLPIKKRSKCNACHDAEGSRGVLMISTNLETMYADLAKNRFQWIISGIIAIIGSAILLSILIRRSITGPIEKTVSVIQRIGGGGASLDERVKVINNDEIGYMATAFNSMLESLKKRDEANTKLFSTLIKSREEWISTFDSIQDLISIHGRDHKIIKLNKALAIKMNKSPQELLESNCYDLFSCYGEKTPHTCPISRAFETGEPNTEEQNDLLGDGAIYEVHTYPIKDKDNEAVACVHIANNITESKTLKEQLLHAEKVTSIGKFVAGIAHELNNPLMGIMGFSQILMDSIGNKEISDAELKDKLTKIYNESLRSAKIVQNLLTFSRSKKINKSSNNLNDIIRITIENRRDALKAHRIEVDLDLEKNIPNAMLDHFQIEQVFINIINNAMEAISEAKVGDKIQISTKLQDNAFFVTFVDNGPGIKEEDIHRVVDPFFTTKTLGKGTGLGLSITHGIIVEHGGSLEIESPGEKGTTVTVKLPYEEIKEKTETIPAPQSLPKENTLMNKKILIADDETSIREVLSELLSTEGFLVETASDGAEALKLIEKETFDLVITDIRMPNMSGPELYDTVVKEHSYLKDKVIVLTGDILGEEAKDFILKSGCLYILKPFNPGELLKVLNKALST